MISAPGGCCNSASSLGLFARQPNQTNTTSTDTTRVAQRPPGTPQASGGQGYSAQALLSAILGALTGDGTTTADEPGESTTQSTQSSDDLSTMLTKLMGAIDTNGDGTLSSDEVKSATDKVSKAFGDKDPAPGLATDSTASGAVPTSLYQSLFQSMAAENGTTYPATLNNNLTQKFMASLQAMA